MYQIMLGDKQVGQAQVERAGLYYKITCVCSFPDNKIYRVTVSDGDRDVKLGVCVPYGDKFSLSTSIPVKYLKGESLCFTIESDRVSGIPVSSGKPFAYLDKLETARLQIANGQSNITID